MTEHPDTREVNSGVEPDVLFHYQPFDEGHFKNTLLNHVVWCSDPRRFNDPWDCAPNIRQDLLESESTRNIWLENFVSAGRGQGLDVDVARKAAEHLLETPERRQEFLALGTETLMMSHENTRLFCLSRRHDSALMWGHYARSHTGVCLGFRRDSAMFARAVPVEYGLEYPTIDPYALTPDELARRILCVKSIDWQYEQEYRLLVKEGADPSGLLTCERGLLNIDPADLMIVILGCRMDSESIALVNELVGQRQMPLMVVQAQKAPSRYELTFGAFA